MPLPDAPDYSKRIYELLKETDLENLSYAQFKGVSEKLFIEPENEDEMRRVVLIQLARMSVRGDWDGFLTGGGGSGGAPTDAEYVVMALNGTLTNERKLTAGSRITITDGGAGGNVTIAADASPVTSLVAGTNITLSPASGLGDVTITAAGGGGGVTFPLEADAGSLSTPSYSFDGDTNTGMYSSTADNLNFVTGGSIRATINSNGLSLGDNTDVGKISSLGTNNLLLQTNNGTNSGKIEIADGAGEDIDLTPNGAGSVRLGDSTGSFLGSKTIIIGDLNATPIDISTKTSVTNAPQTVLQLINGTTSTAAAGSGARIQFRNGDSNFAGFTAGSILSEQIDTTNHNLLIGGEGSGGVVITNLRIKTSSPPSSATDTGVTGSIQYDGNYIYVCVATDTWKRVAISTW